MPAPRIIVPLVAASPDEAFGQLQEACAAGAEAIEWRADCCDCASDVQAVVQTCRRLAQASGGVPVLFTMRTQREGGNAAIDVPAYERLLKAVVEDGACAMVDVELSAGDKVAAGLLAQARQAGMVGVCSHHDFAGTPSARDMIDVLCHMGKLGADVCKIAYTAGSSGDAQRLMAAAGAFAVRAGAPGVIAVSMGQAGAVTRIMGQAFGARYTFATAGPASAPGQLPLQETRMVQAALEAAMEHEEYEAVGTVAPHAGDAKLLALIGSPVAHSLSPAIHHLSFALAGIQALYLALDVPCDKLQRALQALREVPSWAGANVTMPCKQAVIEHLDGLDDAARLMQAVNTISVSDGRLRGYNTDGVGFVASLADAGVDVREKSVVVLGAGGAARAVATQCALDGAGRVLMACRPGSRNAAEASALAGRLCAESTAEVAVIDYESSRSLPSAIKGADIVVNATPVGMGANSIETPVPAACLREDLVVADLVYHPRETALMALARQAGCTVVGGLGMLLHQAAAAERIWLGVSMDVPTIAQQLFSESTR